MRNRTSPRTVFTRRITLCTYPTASTGMQSVISATPSSDRKRVRSTLLSGM